jgi:hypothetical protein
MLVDHREIDLLVLESGRRVVQYAEKGFVKIPTAVSFC